MFIATAIVSVLLAAVLAFSARGKLVKDPQIVTSMQTVHFPLDKLWMLAAAEIAGALGLVIGLAWWPLGALAAVGVILYFVGAVIAHIRTSDYKNTAPPAVILVVAIAALVLRLTTS